MLVNCLKILLRIAMTVLFAGWSMATPAVAQDQQWHVWEKKDQCAMTRQGWLAVARQNPGIDGLGNWLPAPGDMPFPDQDAAFAATDVLRLTSPWFRSQCCKTQVWINPGSGLFSITEEGVAAGSGFTVAVGVPVCCEDAALVAGFDPFGCRSVQLMSLPGVTVQLTTTGPVSPAGPVTIPSSPPLAIAGAPGTDDGVTQAKKHAPGEYLGCFRDPNNPFNLDGFLKRSGDNTPEACIATCRDMGFKYAGVEFSESCLCGNQYDGAGPASNCDMPCTGDPGKICGGSNANSVFATGL